MITWLVFAGMVFAALATTGVFVVALFADLLSDDWNARLARWVMWSIVLGLLCEAFAIFLALPR